MQSAEHSDTYSLAMRSAKPAEVTQARIFQRILEAEFAQLTRACSAAGRLNYTEGKGLHTRIDEIRRLLEGLNGRFQLRSDDWYADSA